MALLALIVGWRGFFRCVGRQGGLGRIPKFLVSPFRGFGNEGMGCPRVPRVGTLSACGALHPWQQNCRRVGAFGW